LNKHLNKHSHWCTRVLHGTGLIVAPLFKKLPLIMEGRGYIHHNKTVPNANFLKLIIQ